MTIKEVIKKFLELKKKEYELTASLTEEEIMEFMVKLKELSQSDDLINALSYSVYLPVEKRQVAEVLRKLIEIELMRKDEELTILDIYKKINNNNDNNIPPPSPYKKGLLGLLLIILSNLK